ncbi:hypothetical protein [Arthrobacter oryzae]|uniref:hypothetical protein n=1 Tax=Arthrobacter oryzae TaxID=409290 RepID=UPI0027895A0E|nr:hypothetical protein [Arthrobacter oryzae]MDQ0077424.1 hypothetical protein [Arthrobacter oryzae]
MTATRRFRRHVAVVLLALTGSLALAGCRISGTATEPTSQGSTMGTSEFSTLDAAGVDQIRATKTARLDMSSGSLTKAAVRVTEDSYGPEINTRDSGKIALTIAAPNGEISGETDRIRFKTTEKRPDFSEVTYFLTAGSADEYFELIRDGVKRYGIDSDSAERWISSAEADRAKRSDFSITSGTATGLEVNYDLRYDGGKDTQVIIVHVSPAT